MSSTTRSFGLPWRTTKSQPNVIVNCGGNTWMARALIGDGETPRLHGDAAFAEDVAALIVTAVNAYEPLVAALRVIAEFPFTDPKNMDAENMAAIARAALEKSDVG